MEDDRFDLSEQENTPLKYSQDVDPLTGLLNRAAVDRRIEKTFSHAENKISCALFLIALDNFARLNEQKGFHAGDVLLCRAASLVVGVFRKGDLIGRVETDRFLVFLSGNITEHLVSEKAQAILDALQLSVGEVTLTSSVGVALYRGSGLSPEQLYCSAEDALAQARAAGKRCYSLVDLSGNGGAEDSTSATKSAALSYRTLLEYMQGGVFLADVGKELRITYASPSICRIAEEKGEDLGEHGECALSQVYQEDLSPLLEKIREAANTGNMVGITFRVGKLGAEWRHLRVARLSLMADGVASIIGVLSDMTEYKGAEEKLRQSEERYRIATELSRAMIWEVDVAARTMFQSEDTSRALGHTESVYSNMPDGLLATGSIHSTSVDDFRRMFRNLYAGDDSGEYTILSSDGAGGFVWLREAFRLVRDERGNPVRAIGIAEKMPNIDQEMSVFEDELRFADTVAPTALGTFRINLTKNTVERTTIRLPEDPKSYTELCEACLPRLHPDDRKEFSEIVRAEKLIRFYHEGNRWLFLEYRWLSENKGYHWITLAINLLGHPVSGDIFLFGYCRRADVRHAWAAAMEKKAERDTATLLYTKESFEEMTRIAVAQMPENGLCSMTVFELMNFDRIKNQNGAQTAQNLLFMIGHLCRIMIDGSVAIGHPSETQFAVFRTGVSSPEEQREGVQRYKNRARLLMEQTMIDVNVDISCGFAVSGKSGFQFEEMLRHATLACQIAQEQPGNPVTEYTDPDDNLYSGIEKEKVRPEEKTRSILVTDDDSVSRFLLRTILEREYLVDEAQDGEQALEMLRKKQYSLMLCDIQMPKKDGWDVMAAMQKEKKLLRTPVVMVTADGAQDSEVKALNLGASDIIVKPIVPEILMSRARNIIGRQEAAEVMERNSLYELRFQQQANLLRQSEFDELTGLLNKQGFIRHVRDKLNSGQGKVFRLVRWDLDNFKMVNDTMGVEAGDRLLRDIGGALQEKDCPEAVIAHLEADHFVIFLPEETALRKKSWRTSTPGSGLIPSISDSAPIWACTGSTTRRRTSASCATARCWL